MDKTKHIIKTEQKYGIATAWKVLELEQERNNRIKAAIQKAREQRKHPK